MIGTSVLLEPQIKIKNPIADNPNLEKQKLKKSISKLNNQLSEIYYPFDAKRQKQINSVKIEIIEKIPSRDHTERLLQECDAEIFREGNNFSVVLIAIEICIAVGKTSFVD